MANVLLIEPDRLLAANIRQYLEGTLRHRVQWRSDAQASINSSEEFPPDVVVLELQLGMHSGVEFLYEFRSYADWQHVPIVILSSVPEAEIGSSTIFWKELDERKRHRKRNRGMRRRPSPKNSVFKEPESEPMT